MLQLELLCLWFIVSHRLATAGWEVSLTSQALMGTKSKRKGENIVQGKEGSGEVREINNETSNSGRNERRKSGVEENGRRC